MSEKQSVEINWMQAAAGALAAVSSAVLLSTVGVAGTLIGAAIGSVIATVAPSVYSYYLSLSRQRVAAARELALARMARARSGGRTVDAEPEPSQERGFDWSE